MGIVFLDSIDRSIAISKIRLGCYFIQVARYPLMHLRFRLTSALLAYALILNERMALLRRRKTFCLMLFELLLDHIDPLVDGANASLCCRAKGIAVSISLKLW